MSSRQDPVVTEDRSGRVEMQRKSAKRISSHDVAQVAGVSQSTVSLVLNGRTDVRISEETRQRVLEAAQSLNYTRNASARALVTGRTHRIGIVPNHPHSLRNRDAYYGDVLAGVIEGALRCNYNLLYHSSHYPNWQALYSDIMSGSADGVLLIGRHPEDPLTHALLESGHPAVCVSSHPDMQGIYGVDCDNELGGYLAMQHLLSLGHRQIAFFYPGEDTSWGKERRQGALRAMAEAGLSETHLRTTDMSFRHAYQTGWIEEAIEFLRSSSPPTTAALFGDETHAQPIIEALPQFGCRIPEDLAVVSFNSTHISARTRPPQTSVWQPLPEIGEAAVVLLAQLIEHDNEGEKPTPGIRRFPMRLDIRETCGAHRNV